MSERLYKFLTADGRSTIQDLPWRLPRDDGQPGEWMPPIEGELVPCKNGYHLCRERDLPFWLDEALYEAEAAGGDRVDVDKGRTKVVVREARLVRRIEAWNERTARLFAADCAERQLFAEREAGREPHPASWAALDVARRYARGQATVTQLDAADSAAYSAAYNAERAWQAARLIAYLDGKEE